MTNVRAGNGTPSWPTAQTAIGVNTAHLTSQIHVHLINRAVQRQTAVTAYFSSKQLLLFAFAGQIGRRTPIRHQSWTCANGRHSWSAISALSYSALYLRQLYRFCPSIVPMLTQISGLLCQHAIILPLPFDVHTKVNKVNYYNKWMIVLCCYKCVIWTSFCGWVEAYSLHSCSPPPVAARPAARAGESRKDVIKWWQTHKMSCYNFACLSLPATFITPGFFYPPARPLWPD